MPVLQYQWIMLNAKDKWVKDQGEHKLERKKSKHQSFKKSWINCLDYSAIVDIKYFFTNIKNYMTLHAAFILTKYGLIFSVQHNKIQATTFPSIQWRKRAGVYIKIRKLSFIREQKRDSRGRLPKLCNIVATRLK